MLFEVVYTCCPKRFYAYMSCSNQHVAKQIHSVLCEADSLETAKRKAEEYIPTAERNDLGIRRYEVDSVKIYEGSQNHIPEIK